MTNTTSTYQMVTGRSPLEVDFDLSERVGRIVGAEPQACWNNSINALFRVHRVGYYVEGWFISPGGVVAEHGWLEVGGVIVDPTPTITRDYPAGGYFPAVRYSMADVSAIISQLDSATPPFVRLDANWGWGLRAFRQACRAAFRSMLGDRAEQALSTLNEQYPMDGDEDVGGVAFAAVRKELLSRRSRRRRR